MRVFQDSGEKKRYRPKPGFEGRRGGKKELESINGIKKNFPTQTNFRMKKTLDRRKEGEKHVIPKGRVQMDIIVEKRERFSK